MSLTNSGKSFPPFLNQHHQKKPNETNKYDLIPHLSKNKRSVDKLTTRPPPKSPPVDDDPWHLDGRKGRYLIIKRHKCINILIAPPLYSQITSQSFESRSEATAVMKIIRRSLITPIPMMVQNTIALRTLPEEVIQPQVYPTAPETSSLFASKQRNSDKTQRDRKISRVQDLDPSQSHVQDSDPSQSHVQDPDSSQSHDTDNKLDDNGHCDDDTTESQKKKKEKKKGHTVYQPTNHKIIRDALTKITRQHRTALLQLKITRSELAHKEGYSDLIDNKQKIIIFIFIFIFYFFTFTFIFILTSLTNFEYNNLLDEKLLFFTTKMRIAIANSFTFARYTITIMNDSDDHKSFMISVFARINSLTS